MSDEATVTVKVHVLKFSLESGIKLINGIQHFSKTREKSQQVRKWSLLVLLCHIECWDVDILVMIFRMCLTQQRANIKTKEGYYLNNYISC